MTGGVIRLDGKYDVMLGIRRSCGSIVILLIDDYGIRTLAGEEGEQK